MGASTQPSSVREAPPGTLPAVDGEEALRLQNVTKIFGDGLAAVRDLTLSVGSATILGLIGPSGSGKTTTIRLLTGSLAPTRGRIHVLGENPRQFHRRTRERIGYMPQQFTLYPDLTARENINFVASLFGLLWPRRRRRVSEVLRAVELWDARGRRASDLSGGMQRRLELACALVHEPTLLFLDEPTAGIDPLLRARIWEELHGLKEAGRTLLVTTQYVNEAEECDVVALLSEGQLIALDTPDGLRRKATGGDVIEVQTDEDFMASTLTTLPMVRGVSQQAPRVFHVTVDEAGVATPDVVAAIVETGAEVSYAREYQPSFDEVFGELVGRAGTEAPPPDADERDTNKARGAEAQR
jgi:ABC-2 type transport system ATP-binding protein